MSVSAQICRAMVDEPGLHLDKWQDVIDHHPYVACRFHEIICRLDLRFAESYYRILGRYLVHENRATPEVPPDLLASIAIAECKSLKPRWAKTVFDAHFSYYRQIKRLHGDPEYLIPARAAIYMLNRMTSHYAPFVKAARIESGEDLLEFVQALSSDTRDRGDELNNARAGVARRLVEQNLDRVNNPDALLKVNLPWLNQAVFANMSVEDRELRVKESLVAGEEQLSGIPYAVYSRDVPDRAWSLSSRLWTDSEKADYLNNRSDLSVYCYSSWFLTTHGSWSKETPFSQEQLIRVQAQHKKLIFPYKITLSLGSMLNTHGMMRLAGFLVGAPLNKIKVELDRQALEEFNNLVLTSGLRREKGGKEEKVLKHVNES